MLFNPTYTWQFTTEPGEGTAGRRIPTTQGRTLGGSSSINGMVYNRGQKADFDHWAQRGNRGWGYADVLPYFKRTERRIGAADDRFHGREGNMPVTTMDLIHPVCEAFIDGAVAMGMPRHNDYNSDKQAGVGYFQRAIFRGWRRSAARVFLHPARARGTLDVRTDARAAAILFEGRRAVGVRYVDDRDRKTQHTVRARREVILCSGTANTARLLQISGLVRGRAAGLACPWCMSCAAWARICGTITPMRLVARVKDIRHHQRNVAWVWAGRADRALGAGKTLDPGGDTVAGALVLEVGQSLDGADLQGVFSPASYKQGFVGLLDDFPGMTAGVWQHRPESVGYVRARSADPFQDPSSSRTIWPTRSIAACCWAGCSWRGGCWNRRS